MLPYKTLANLPLLHDPQLNLMVASSFLQPLVTWRDILDVEQQIRRHPATIALEYAHLVYKHLAQLPLMLEQKVRGPDTVRRACQITLVSHHMISPKPRTNKRIKSINLLSLDSGKIFIIIIVVFQLRTRPTQKFLIHYTHCTQRPRNDDIGGVVVDDAEHEEVLYVSQTVWASGLVPQTPGDVRCGFKGW